MDQGTRTCGVDKRDTVKCKAIYSYYMHPLRWSGQKRRERWTREESCISKSSDQVSGAPDKCLVHQTNVWCARLTCWLVVGITQ